MIELRAARTLTQLRNLFKPFSTRDIFTGLSCSDNSFDSRHPGSQQDIRGVLVHDKIQVDPAGWRSCRERPQFNDRLLSSSTSNYLKVKVLLVET